MISNQSGDIAGADHISPNSDIKISAGPGPQLMAAGLLTDDKVVDARNNTLGKIEELMLDVLSGRIAYAVMSCGEGLGIEGRLFAIPWRALTLDADNECFLLDIDKDRLEKAPDFNQDHWPSMADPRWAASIHHYYDRRPYWE